ncbi:MAG TPA: GntP family permease [Cyclobacteriaceae bacterium]|nr:GntP family permease [Cyclobacteriaceae bacterium]
MIQVSIALLISIAALISVSRYFKLHAFFALLLAAVLFGLIMGKPFLEIFTSMQSGFGLLLQQIGFLVAIGSCLGTVMEKTGAMATLGNKIITAFGTSRTTLAMAVIGLLVGIPVFCDSGFIILSRLIPALASSAATPTQLSLTLSTSLYTSHTLIPPTPGPLAAAANLGATSHLGLVMLVGLIGSIPITGVAYFLSRKLGLRITTTTPAIETPEVHPHSTILIFIPLVIPIVLIALASLPTLIPALQSWSILQVIGNPAVALLIGLSFSFLLIRSKQKQTWPGWISEALKDAGIILLITGAGGAFGAVIKSSGLDLILKDVLADSQAGGIVFLLIAFALAAILKTAQGSSTSAIIITSSLLAPLTAGAGFSAPLDLATLILAIGGGAMTVSHANDSYFWVVSQFSGIRERDAYKSFTLITLAQGLTALATSVLIYLL